MGSCRLMLCLYVPVCFTILTVLLLDSYDAALPVDNRFCTNTTVLRARAKCHSCRISPFVACVKGFKVSPGTLAKDCDYVVRTASLNLSISGCSFECYKEVEQKICCPGYWGADCLECPEYATAPCNNNGVCSEGLGGNGTCSCKAGFAGTACEDCAEDRYGPTCSSVCSCEHGLCNRGLRGDGTCTCFSGYRGPNCDLALPECAALSCGENSRCIEASFTGKLECRCKVGYQASGAQCTSVNPCARKPCHEHATCAHTGPDQHTCACADGYSGDGRVCMAIDPCQVDQGGCSVGTARCLYDGPGKSHCECLPGFNHLEGGVRCSLTDLCRPDSCHKNANCSTVEPLQVECTCHQGFLGNGKICYGNIMYRLYELNTEPGGQWTGQLSTAISLLGTLSWALSNLGPFTVFVPINKGFRGTAMKPLLADLSKVKYLCKLHMVAGEMSVDTLRKTDTYYTLTGKAGEIDTSEGESLTKIRIHGSRKKGLILQSDVIASNGVIHIINKLMDSVSPTVDSDNKENLMHILSSYGKFDQFKSLLQKADLGSVLALPGPYTVFAPIGTSFNAMEPGHLQYLSSEEGSRKLLELLRNHIVPSTKLEVFNAVSSPRIVTMANQVLTFNVTENGQILVNGALVLETDVEAKNGHLYSLDGVLVPASIQPVLPHRCDVTENRIVQGDCVSCSTIIKSSCPSGVVSPGAFTFDCRYRITSPDLTIMGCSLSCNETITTPVCCAGFYGPDCSPCPGGFQSACMGHGQCMEGIEGNGTCICEAPFRGSRCQYCSDPNKYGAVCDKACECVHGVCDSRVEGNGRCKPGSCVQGYTGRNCERQTQACGGQWYCHAHADCVTGDTESCVCKPGYEGDGITCEERDPCAPPLRGGCSVNAKCIKTGAGSHTCQCLTGWEADGDECKPYNNCERSDRGGCHSNATCIYVGPGQSDCMCKAGFRGTGRDCDAVNQCARQSGGCHYLANCQLLSGRWECVCEDGYSGDGTVCYGTVEQELQAVPEASEFIKWLTDSGLSRSLSEMNVTLLVPSSAAMDKMSKEDKDFWTAKGNLPSIVRNHMIQGNYPISALRDASISAQITSLLKTLLPVSTTNESTVIGGATITTANVAATNGLIHVIDKVLVPERKMSEGLLELLSLRPEFSLFRTYLVQHNLTDEIEQADEYTVFAPTDDAVKDYLKKMAAVDMDVNTTRYHVVLSQRLLKTDLQTGGYKETMLGFSFQLGLFPRDGKLFVNEAQVNVSNILTGKGVIHGLSSVLEISRNRCDKAQYQTTLGSCQDCFYPQGKPCPIGTTPLKLILKRNCMFSRVYQGESLLSIGCKATCMKTSIIRRCCGGFFGEHCEPCPGPTGLPCFGNGACTDGTNGTGVCGCNAGFTGTACETCQAGKYGVHCDQECTCKSGQCNDGIKGDGTCECDVGWKGVLCDEKIESKADELCGLIKCHTSANCAILPSSTQCICAAGFEGNGTSCTARDACAVDNGGCSPYAVCKRTRPGRRDCACNTGYGGDGLVCVEINPCLDGNGGCHANADCIHTGPNKTSCTCSQGYAGNGQTCKMIDLCRKKNGDCSVSARCNMTGPGVRTCTCTKGYMGDGLTCKGTVGKELIRRKLRDFYMALMIAEVSLMGRGPFTVFAPTAEAFEKGRTVMRALLEQKQRDKYAEVIRNHIVLCHTLLPSDLATPRNLTTLGGNVLTTSVSQGFIFIDKANVTRSDDVSTNGIIHEIDSILFPPGMEKEKQLSSTPVDRRQSLMISAHRITLSALTQVNLTDVADQHGYKTFYKLLEDTDMMDQVNDPLQRPLTVFLPTDRAMATLPQAQKDFLYGQHNRQQLLEYLQYHILREQKVSAAELIHLDSARTLQGSPLTFRCGGTSDMGEIFVNGGTCRVVQRHLRFSGGTAYGIDCLLTPPSVGGRCDAQKTFELKMNCGPCTSSSTRCPSGSKVTELQVCDLPMMFVSKNSGCRSVCAVDFWQPKCCSGYHGRDCLACPGGAGSPCTGRGKCDEGHLGNGTCACDVGFQGVACELCSGGHYGPTCQACNCTEHGSCDQGLRGRGSCFCDSGWTGARCELQQAEGPVCSPPCSAKGVCQDNNTCVCRPLYEGDGLTCTVADLCGVLNGGCAAGARCSQVEAVVSCVCPRGHSGDGVSCQPIDPCAAGDNGGCHEHATCTMTGPGKKRCACKQNYVGDGVSCEVKEPLTNRCLQDNGQCHQDAACTDLHYEDATVGVFHLRAAKGQYKMDYAAARQACAAEGGALATYNQLSYAQQAGLNLCAAGWLEESRVAYPTTYSNPNCGFGHVGIVDYGPRKNLSETWDAFCYRVKEVKCECQPGYIGDGYTCTGNLMDVLRSRPAFSNFLTQILNYSQISEAGRQFVTRLSNVSVQSTLFVPENTGLAENQTLTRRDIEYHFSEGHALALSDLKNGSRIRTRLGSLTVLGIADFLNPKALSSRYINERFVTDSDILASNGIIHVLQGPLRAPPPPPVLHAGHKAGMGVGVILLIVLIAGVIFVGYHFYTHKTKPFHFHYFKEEEEEEEDACPDCNPSICNPVYNAEPEPTQPGPAGSPENGEKEPDRSICNPVYDAEPDPPQPGPTGSAEDKHEVANGGSYDLLQDS